MAVVCYQSGTVEIVAGLFFNFIVFYNLTCFLFCSRTAELIGDFFINRWRAKNNSFSLIMRQYYWRTEAFYASKQSASNKKKQLVHYNSVLTSWQRYCCANILAQGSFLSFRLFLRFRLSCQSGFPALLAFRSFQLSLRSGYPQAVTADKINKGELHLRVRRALSILQEIAY